MHKDLFILHILENVPDWCDKEGKSISEESPSPSPFVLLLSLSVSPSLPLSLPYLPVPLSLSLSAFSLSLPLPPLLCICVIQKNWCNIFSVFYKIDTQIANWFMIMLCYKKWKYFCKSRFSFKNKFFIVFPFIAQIYLWTPCPKICFKILTNAN